MSVCGRHVTDDLYICATVQLTNFLKICCTVLEEECDIHKISNLTPTYFFFSTSPLPPPPPPNEKEGGKRKKEKEKKKERKKTPLLSDICKRFKEKKTQAGGIWGTVHMSKNMQCKIVGSICSLNHKRMGI